MKVHQPNFCTTAYCIFGEIGWGIWYKHIMIQILTTLVALTTHIFSQVLFITEKQKYLNSPLKILTPYQDYYFPFKRSFSPSSFPRTSPSIYTSPDSGEGQDWGLCCPQLRCSSPCSAHWAYHAGAHRVMWSQLPLSGLSCHLAAWPVTWSFWSQSKIRTHVPDLPFFHDPLSSCPKQASIYPSCQPTRNFLHTNCLLLSLHYSFWQDCYGLSWPYVDLDMDWEASEIHKNHFLSFKKRGNSMLFFILLGLPLPFDFILLGLKSDLKPKPNQ